MSHYPNFKDKHANTPVFNPDDFLAYLKKANQLPKFSPPKSVILCYSRTLVKYASQVEPISIEKSMLGTFHFFKNADNEIALCRIPGIGAPVSIAILDPLIALGVRNFVIVGQAGTIQHDLKIGDLVICEKALRDEGVSHHYMAHDRYATASEPLTKELLKAAQAAGATHTLGSSWTVDAFYRETREEVLAYQKEGISVVEMEAAAVFSVARFRGADASAVFAVSDSLANLQWEPDFDSAPARKGLEQAFNVAFEALKR